MTVKAGQKCTAIRRAFVPEQHVDAVVEAVSARLAKTIVGDPAAEGVRMGALASLEQREEVRRSVKALADAGPDRRSATRRRSTWSAPTPSAARSSPRSCWSPTRSGPSRTRSRRSARCRTVMPYTCTAQVIELAARGQGSLAGSIVTADPAFAREVVLGVAPWHGRLLVLNERDAKESTGHGSPLPALVHGGPGRAGGGEEMGGIRGVLHHMQRTAVQADPDTLTAITGRWVTGVAAPRDRRAPVPQAPRGAARRATRSSPARAGSPRRTSSTSPSSPATPSTRTWTPRPPRPTRCSASGSRTAT